MSMRIHLRSMAWHRGSRSFDTEEHCRTLLNVGGQAVGSASHSPPLKGAVSAFVSMCQPVVSPLARHTQPEMVTRRILQVELYAQVALRGLNRLVAEAELDLL